MNKDEQEYLDAKEEQELRSVAQRMGLRSATEHNEQTVHNERFLNELRKAGIDSESFDWIEEEFPTWFAGPHAVSNRGNDWDLMADLGLRNKRERAIAQDRPGRLLRDRPFMLAVMQGADSPPAEAYQPAEVPGNQEYWNRVLRNLEIARTPVSSEEFSRIYGAAEVAADLWSLSRNAAGLESVSTVKTETNVRRAEETNETASKVGRFLE